MQKNSRVIRPTCDCHRQLFKRTVHTLQRFWVFLFVLIFSFGSVAQQSTVKKAQKRYEKAEKAYKARDFPSALDALEDATLLDPDFWAAYARMGHLYHAMGQVDSVYAKFTQYLRCAPSPSSAILEKMAVMAFDRGHYATAATYLDTLLQKVPEKRQTDEMMRLKQSLDFVALEINRPDTRAISALPAEINRFDLQYLPTMTVDQATLIYTKRDVATDDEDIVVSYRQDGAWQPATSISPKVNTKLNEGACSISADGRTMIFTACDRRDSYGSCDLFITTKSGAHWATPKNLGAAVNTKYWESQPSLSADGKTLYFVSNRPGGEGGRDIWVARRQLNGGGWRKPQNAGPAINSPKDDITPFIHFDGVTLYFSSDGYPGMGGFDLFQTRWKTPDSTWAKPKNLGAPVNSFRDEVALMVSADGATGYFAKETKKGSEILDSKLMQLTLPAAARPVATSYVSGRVVDAQTNAPLRAAIQVVDVQTGGMLYDHQSDSLTGQFYMVLPTDKELAGYVKKSGYLFKDFHFSLGAQQADTLLIRLSKIAVGEELILRNIYFETNSYQLSPKSYVEIENAAALLRDHSKLAVLIEGHTDDIGGDAYNQTLSEKRAREVYQALLRSGIGEERLRYEGFGAASPLVPNRTDRDRQNNRRIAFRVLRAE